MKKVIKVIEDNMPELLQLAEAGFTLAHIKYLPMYYDYVRCLENNWKRTWTRKYLAEKYNLGERTVYTILESFAKNI